MICSTTGMPHPGDPCERCAAFERRLAAARTDPRYLAALENSERAFAAYQAGRALSLEEWLKLESAWRKSNDEAQVLFSELLRAAV